MTSKNEQPIHLLVRATESRCQNCPPDRVCAWACVQGAGVEDIMIGAVLEQSQSWALNSSEAETVGQNLWEVFNS
jgi:hypothetical protein